jgi:uncharacterized protein YjiS (DUF1127 family)
MKTRRRIAEAMAQILEAIRQRWKAGRTRRSVEHLDEHLLRDVGLQDYGRKSPPRPFRLLWWMED